MPSQQAQSVRSVEGTPVQRHTVTPKPQKTPKTTTPGSSLPAPPLDDVHAAFVEFRAKEEDKCLSVQCIYCNQIRAKNTSRQRQHLMECATYQNVMKESIPANNLLHRFDEGDIARSLQLPTPTLELDFRISIKLNPKISVGGGLYGHREWVSIVGGQWAGRWGKGIIIVSRSTRHTIAMRKVLLLTVFSPVDKTNSWWSKILLRASTPIISSKPMTTLLHTSLQKPRAGVLAPKKSSNV
jgi:hypothetical protein